MKSKKVIILVAVIVIFVGVIVFLFDSFASKIANEKALELDLPDFITHGDVSVSSIGSRLIIKDVLIKLDNEDQTVYCDEIRIGTSYKEIFNIIKTKEFNELGSFDLEFKNIIVNSTDDNIFKHKIASYVSIEYDGTLTQEMVQNIEYEFPAQDQRLAVKVSDFNIPIEAGILQELIPNIKTDLSTDCKFTIAFSPTTKQIELQNLYVKNEYISTSLDLKLDYKGTKPDNMVPIKIDVNGKSNFDLDDMVLGDKDMSINMGKGSLNFAFFIDGYASVGNIVSGKLKGENDYKRIWYLSGKLTRYSIIISLILVLVCTVGYNNIGALFTKEQEVRVLFKSIFWIVLIMQPINALAFVFDGIFKGLAEAAILRNLLLIATFLGFVPTLLITDYFDLKLTGIWIAFTVWMMIRGGLLLVKFRSDYLVKNT